MDFNFKGILAYQILDNAVLQYFIAIAVFLALFFVLKIFKNIIILRLKRLSEKTKTDIDDLLIKIISSVRQFFYLFLSFYIAVRFLNGSELFFRIINYLFFLIIIYYIVKAIESVIDYGAEKLVEKRKKQEKELSQSVVSLLTKIIKAVIWMLAVIIVLQNLGYNITTLAAGLGIGGIAIALALQNILGDLFASFAIYFDKPFEIGDYIVIGDDAGTVTQIGIKSTRIQSRQGEQLIISNKELTSARVHNYKKMEKRRIVFSFGLIYGTPAEKLRKVPDIIREIIESIEIAGIDRVFFKEFGEFSLNFEVVYWLKTSDYKGFVESQPKINLAIIEAFQREGIEMAYPTQTIFVKK